jgi:hypothetical protein
MTINTEDLLDVEQSYFLLTRRKISRSYLTLSIHGIPIDFRFRCLKARAAGNDTMRPLFHKQHNPGKKNEITEQGDAVCDGIAIDVHLSRG